MPAAEVYDALRGALYFDGAGVARPVELLALWTVAGVGLLLLGQLTSGRRTGT
jgi:hypothetical protein